MDDLDEGIQDMASVGERLKARLDEIGMSVATLADQMGITIQAIHNVIRDPNAGMHSVNAGKAAVAIGVNERWLVSGLGPKLRLDALKDDEAELLESFRTLDDDLKKALITMARGMKKK